MKAIAILSIVFVNSIWNGIAVAGSVGGATELTQMLNNIELIGQSAQMYQQVQNTIMQIQHSQQQLKNLIVAPQMVWGNFQADLQQLTQLVAQGQP